ncbi:FMN-binding glutamate synthase family protein [bacterium LRH843]|nr:FMN-binding glutamate synthase family protein [bacterium LRH843]
MQNIFIIMTFAMIAILFVLFFCMLIGWRSITKKIVAQTTDIVFNDSYQENLLELMPGLSHIGIQPLLENNLRSASGDLLHRPLGSAAKKWPNMDVITFIPAQTSPFPVGSDEDVDVSVTIGPKAKKPLTIKIPMMISGMAYGIALSEEARLALAGAASNVGTAINSGEGGVIPEELDKAGKYILQFSKTKWSKEELLIKRANMIEVKLGQGALLGMGGKISPENITGRAREIMGLEENEDAIIHEHFFENQTLQDIKDLVDELRTLSGGVPIGVKLAAGGKIEEDIDNLIAVGVDFIAIDGGQAATMGAPPILSDDFGIPTLHAIVRAANHLEKRNMKGQISLISAGGHMVPGHFLKALALGADAVYLGSAMLFAISHNQTSEALPFEPPTQIVWNQGKFKDSFNMEEGEKSAEHFLNASTEEIKIALRAMGKRSLKELSRQDLVSYDDLTAKMIGIPFTFEPWQDQSQCGKQSQSQSNQQANQSGQSSGSQQGKQSGQSEGAQQGPQSGQSLGTKQGTQSSQHSYGTSQSGQSGPSKEAQQSPQSEQSSGIEKGTQSVQQSCGTEQNTQSGQSEGTGQSTPSDQSSGTEQGAQLNQSEKAKQGTENSKS